MKKVEDYVRSIPDFPEKGIIFRDVTSVLQDADGQASAVIDVAVKVGVGEEVESRYNVPFQLITADNVDDYLE